MRDPVETVMGEVTVELAGGLRMSALPATALRLMEVLTGMLLFRSRATLASTGLVVAVTAAAVPFW
jgi:hypothetical protein